MLGERGVREDLISEAAESLRQCAHAPFSAAGKEGEAESLKRPRAVLKKLERAIR